jgi:hypothetical protein
MVAVRMMEVAADAVVDVSAVRNRLMAAAGAVDMTRLMAAATMVGGAVVGVLTRHLDHVLVDMTLVRMVQVTIMQVIDVAGMMDGGMATTLTMLVSMIGVAWC